jgi:hypothetical protein
MYTRLRIYLIVLFLFPIACALTPLEAGLVGAVAGTTTTMLLDSDPDIIVGDGATVVQEQVDNAYGLLAVLIDNAWSVALVCLVFWFLPNPSQIRRLLKKKAK